MSDPIVNYEAGQTAVAMAALSDSGDHQIFNSADELWSNRSGYQADVKPNGVLTGLVVSAAASGSNDVVDVSAGTLNLNGVVTSVSAGTDESVARADSTYLLLSFASGGYTDCVAGDIGKTVTGGVTGDTGELIAYNNTTRQWVVDQADAEDLFDDDDEAITIATGTGAGTLNAVGAECSHKILSVTINSGGSIAVVAGTEGTAFSTTRGEIGGPPFIPTTSVEIAQVRYTSNTSAAVDADEIFQVPNTHREMALFPTWVENRVRTESGVMAYAGVEFNSALPLIHTGSVPKAVHASYYTPSFAQVAKASDFVRPAESKSVSSSEYYGGARGSTSTSINQGSFKAFVDTLNDGLLQMEGEDLWFKFLNDRLLTTPYIISQGVLGISEAFDTDGGIEVSATISAETAGVRVLG